ncbi:glutamate/aspartate:proton symporter GltP [Acinetobacter portensis]|uniref:Probable proton/glutamate-aspartate symporter n=2 Tax=Acinetobacter TaxID=469 RepID=A0A6L6GF42_9GAMM|nr:MULTISPECIES: glutamate/aspartate:proton symporter GltP [Acinetobacter]MCK7608914.1 glutamate/aspartate:proton symporter GltP [Acinetobacter portensis]MCK7639728.1 glutamate/aspartate:proton symporter GltP [Acinetobacter portensis]MDY6449720.1 glutamate/aspartate:proton symporter GltP [Acinetobacter faecalis]MDY6458810.1 glutamate/aspartate:proton symporter GltP [Acinetobacter faecalis]MDY6462363.1 glutamate/aspartate:proton symporter GltP [Acinetobacter faecalis]
MKRIKISLAWQIVIALIVGVLVGSFLHYSPEYRDDLVTNFLNPLGSIFITLIKMIVVPLVVSMLILGIANSHGQSLGKLGFKTILYFEIITTIAIVVGLVAANVFQPGAGIDMSSLTQVDISKYAETTHQVSEAHHGLIQTILSVIPSNFFAALTSGQMLPIIFFSVMFGIGLGALDREVKQPLLNVLNAVSETMFKVVHMIMKFAPIGVFGLIAATVANFGFSSLLPLLKLALLVYGAIFFFIFAVLGVVAKICGFSIWTIIRILKDELILAYSTASSETVLPRIMEKMEAYGAPKPVTSFVIPLGYSFNLDGSTLYQSIAAIFIAQLYGIDLTLTQEITLVLTLMITSKGIAGVPGVSFVVLLATLGSVGIPLEGLAFIAGIDRILDMARTALNVIGNALAVLVISKWEGVFDQDKRKEYELELNSK